MMTGRKRFQAALSGTKVDRHPAWLMRQAGRYLPEYRALKEKHDFHTLVKTPELACEVTLQPLRRFPKIDAAIVFSDILVIPEAMGIPYHFRDRGGIGMEKTISSSSDVALLTAESITDTLSYVGEALKILRTELADEKALIGFCGAPWTLAQYMLEGGSPGEGSLLRQMIYQYPECAEQLLAKITRACTDYLKMQEASGVDALQLFDSWAGLCPGNLYQDWCLRWIQEIIEELRVPVILFSRGAGQRISEQCQTGACALGLDWSTSLTNARKVAGPEMTLQGNLDPMLLETSPQRVREEVRRMLRPFSQDNRLIVNAGHGVAPTTKIDCVEAFFEEIEQNPLTHTG